MGYKNRRNEKKDIFIKMRGESLLNARALSVGIKNDIKSVLQKCYPSVYEFQIVMATKKQKLKDFFENEHMEKEIKEEYLQILQNKLNDQKIKQSSTLIKHIARIEQYEDKGAQFIRRPTKFLNFVKRRHFLKIKDTPNVAQLPFFP